MARLGFPSMHAAHPVSRGWRMHFGVAQGGRAATLMRLGSHSPPLATSLPRWLGHTAPRWRRAKPPRPRTPQRVGKKQRLLQSEPARRARALAFIGNLFAAAPCKTDSIRSRARRSLRIRNGSRSWVHEVLHRSPQLQDLWLLQRPRLCTAGGRSADRVHQVHPAERRREPQRRSKHSGTLRTPPWMHCAR